MSRPTPNEAAEYYFTYINQVTGEDAKAALREQIRDADSLFGKVDEERSLYRPAPGKWSVREVLSHVNDAERLFTFRAFWFARGLEAALPSFDQEVAARSAEADRRSWQELVAEFRSVRAATIDLFEGFPAEAWSRTGTASGMSFSVRALAFITAGHFAHHMRILREQYALLN